MCITMIMLKFFEVFEVLIDIEMDFGLREVMCDEYLPRNICAFEHWHGMV